MKTLAEHEHKWTKSYSQHCVKMNAQMSSADRLPNGQFTKGHRVSEEVRAQMRETRLGSKSEKDWRPVYAELAIQNPTKYVTTEKMVPDAVGYRDGKLVAIEIEKKKHLNTVKKKMQMYDDNQQFGYDEVIVIWYTPDSIRRKVWHFKDGGWQITFNSGYDERKDKQNES